MYWVYKWNESHANIIGTAAVSGRKLQFYISGAAVEGGDDRCILSGSGPFPVVAASSALPMNPPTYLLTPYWLNVSSCYPRVCFAVIATTVAAATVHFFYFLNEVPSLACFVDFTLLFLFFWDNSWCRFMQRGKGHMQSITLAKCYFITFISARKFLQNVD